MGPGLVVEPKSGLVGVYDWEGDVVTFLSRSDAVSYVMDNSPGSWEITRLQFVSIWAFWNFAL